MSSAKKKKQATEAAPKYIDFKAMVKREGELLLQLIRHPDCLLEELLPHMMTYRKNRAALVDLTEKLRKTFPLPYWGEVRNFPWWDK